MNAKKTNDENWIPLAIAAVVLLVCATITFFGSNWVIVQIKQTSTSQSIQKLEPTSSATLTKWSHVDEVEITIDFSQLSTDVLSCGGYAYAVVDNFVVWSAAEPTGTTIVVYIPSKANEQHELYGVGLMHVYGVPGGNDAYQDIAHAPNQRLKVGEPNLVYINQVDPDYKAICSK